MEPEPEVATPAPEPPPAAMEPPPPAPAPQVAATEPEPKPEVMQVARAPQFEPEPPPTVPVDTLDALRATLKINAIRYSREDPRAIVNLKRVFEGDTVDGAKIVRIERDRIVFEADGAQFTLRF